MINIWCIQEPLLDWEVICYQIAIAKLEGDLWIIFQIIFQPSRPDELHFICIYDFRQTSYLIDIQKRNEHQFMHRSDYRWTSNLVHIQKQRDFLAWSQMVSFENISDHMWPSNLLHIQKVNEWVPPAPLGWYSCSCDMGKTMLTISL